MLTYISVYTSSAQLSLHQFYALYFARIATSLDTGECTYDHTVLFSATRSKHTNEHVDQEYGEILRLVVYISTSRTSQDPLEQRKTRAPKHILNKALIPINQPSQSVFVLAPPKTDISRIVNLRAFTWQDCYSMTFPFSATEDFRPGILDYSARN